jgi:hypothetical protein
LPELLAALVDVAWVCGLDLEQGPSRPTRERSGAPTTAPGHGDRAARIASNHGEGFVVTSQGEGDEEALHMVYRSWFSYASS